MRFRDLLLEYRRDATEQRFGAKLVDRFTLDPNADRACEKVENDFKQQFGEDQPEEKVMAYFFNRIMDAIELYIHNKTFIPWVVSRYISKGILLWEDIPRANYTINQYVALRKGGYFKRHPEDNAEFGDINRFKTLSDLGEFVMRASEDGTSNAEKDREKERDLIVQGDAVVVRDDAEWKIVIPKTEDASIYFGRNTQWCTAASTSDNMFANYAERGDLFIILLKKSNRRWQLHVNTAQFMDENDRPVPLTPIADLIDEGAFDSEFERLSNAKGSMELMRTSGFTRNAQEKIIETLSPLTLAAINIAYWDANRREFRSSSAPPMDDYLNGKLGECLVSHTGAKHKTKTFEGVKQHSFSDPAELFMYAASKQDIGTLQYADFSCFSYSTLSWFEEALAELTDCNVFEIENGRRVYYAVFNNATIQLANNAGVDYLSIGDWIDTAKNQKFLDRAFDPPVQTLIKAVAAYFEQTQKRYGMT